MNSSIGIRFPGDFEGKVIRWEQHWNCSLQLRRNNSNVITRVLGDSGGEDLVHFVLYSGIGGLYARGFYEELYQQSIS
jgi:hypothetical protein